MHKCGLVVRNEDPLKEKIERWNFSGCSLFFSAEVSRLNLETGQILTKRRVDVSAFTFNIFTRVIRALNGYISFCGFRRNTDEVRTSHSE